MASGTNTSSTFANVIPTVLARARDVVEKPTIMTDKKVVTVVSIKDGDGTTFNWPKFGTGLVAQTLTENVPIANRQTLVPTTQQFTTNEVGVSTIMTDKAIRVTPEPMRARAGKFMGNAMRRKFETDMLGLFSGLGRDLGNAGDPFTPGWIAAAKVRLVAASESGQTEPVEGEILAILHPFHAHDFLTSSATLGSNINADTGYHPIDGWTQALVEEYDLKRIYGVTLAQAPLIAIDGDDDAVSAIFNRMAFIHVKTSHTMKTETDRDVELRANIVVTTSEYGTGELEDQFGISATADATAPTA